MYCLKSRLANSPSVFSVTYSFVKITVQFFSSKSGASKFISSSTASTTVRSRLAPMLSSSFNATDTLAISSIAPISNPIVTCSVPKSSTDCCSKLCSVFVSMCLKSVKLSDSILALIGSLPYNSIANSLGFVFSKAPAPTKRMFLVLTLTFWLTETVVPSSRGNKSY